MGSEMCIRDSAFQENSIQYILGPLLSSYLLHPPIRNLAVAGKRRENTFRILERVRQWHSMEIVKHGGVHEFCVESFYLLLASSTDSHRREKVSFLQMTLKWNCHPNQYKFILDS